MAQVPVVYPAELPHPQIGRYTPAERRAINREVMRPISRDRQGRRSVQFTFTPLQAAIFRDWYDYWLVWGGGFFAVNWPMPWGRGPHSVRFVDPPRWQLIGGGLDGQGYWQVSGEVELQGRGDMPMADVGVLTSALYPVVARDSINAEYNVADAFNWNPPYDRLNASYDIESASLEDVMKIFYEDVGFEKLDASYDIESASLEDVMKIFYEDVGFDELDAAYDVDSASLEDVKALVDHDQTGDQLNAAYDIEAASLTNV